MNRLSLTEGRRLKSLRSPAHRKLTRRLTAARTAAGLTQTALAEKLGRHQSFVAKYESGERRLEVIEFLQICRELGVSTNQVLRDLV
jgi:transcriptional regulator with XRE-family HTH domain